MAELDDYDVSLLDDVMHPLDCVYGGDQDMYTRMGDSKKNVARTVSVGGEASKGLARHRHILDGDGEVLLEFGTPTDVEGAHPGCSGRISG